MHEWFYSILKSVSNRECCPNYPTSRISIINIKNSKLDGTIPEALKQRAERDGNFFIFDQK